MHFQPENSRINILGVGNPFFDRIQFVDVLPEGLKKGNTHIVEKNIIEQTWKATQETAVPAGKNTTSLPLFINNEDVTISARSPAQETQLDAQWSFGGSCPNVIKVLTHLLKCFNMNHSCSLLGMVGKDKKEEVLKNLSRFSINSLLIEGKDDNGLVNSFVTPDKERTLQTFGGASFELSNKYILPEHFKNISHVHLEGYLAYFDKVLPISIQQAQENKATISLDLSSVDVVSTYSENFKECTQKVDIIFGNLKEMHTFTGCSEVVEMMNSFADAQIVIITDGAQGGYIKPAQVSQIIKFQAPQIENIVDATGAGDFFSAGFLAGLLAKKDIQTCIEIAKLAASFVLQERGADLSESQWEKLKEQAIRL